LRLAKTPAIGYSISNEGGAVMQAYEFYATPENGALMIPEKYRNKITSGVKVILLEDTSWKFDREEANARSRTDLLSPLSIDTRGWKFDKEEANER